MVAAEPEVLDAVVGEVGFFERFKNRFVTAIKNWLGNQWLLPQEVGNEVLATKIVGGFIVADIGPGYVERRFKRDITCPAWMDLKSVPGRVVKVDQESAVWR
jgi:hypothetical protein